MRLQERSEVQVTDRALRWLEYPRFNNPQMPRYPIQVFEQGIFNDGLCSSIIGHPVNFRMHHTKEQSVSGAVGYRFCDQRIKVNTMTPSAVSAPPLRHSKG